MQVVFRSDASLDIGAGHVMRCLTLANALATRGARCSFIMAEHEGNLMTLVKSAGHAVYMMKLAFDQRKAAFDDPGHDYESWLGRTPQEDAALTTEILAGMGKPDWLVVDHYGIDHRWEWLLRPYARRLMVIDDLADREHECDVLLDQNLGRKAVDYSHRVPEQCTLLIGPRHALLRPEFHRLRGYSLTRRGNGVMNHLLITMGGVDRANVTSTVLALLPGCEFQRTVKVTVVLGLQSPWVNEVKSLARDLSASMDVQVLVGVSDMARLMADADLCVGAAGSTSWERCALGLPGVLVCLAHNQESGLKALVANGAALMAVTRGDGQIDRCRLRSTLIDASRDLTRMAKASAAVCDGSGVTTVLDHMAGLA